MEWKIGEIREINGEWYQCVENWFGCKGCDFKNTSKCSYAGTKCSFPIRQDHTSVIFKKLEKVGEPCEFQKRTIQTYKLYTEPFISFDMDFICTYLNGSNTIDIIIKQDKEDMEEKKLNLKPFDLQKAREGKPVCTKDGRKARIICFDRVDAKPILALIASTDGKGEDVFDYFVSGKRIANALESDLDLMMIPEKKEGWINVYKMKESTFGYITAYFDTEEKAKEDKEQLTGYVATVKINWEE